MSNLDKKTDALNQSGAFLQIHTLNQLKNRNWYTEIESPRTVAPFVSDPKEQREILYRGDPNRMRAEKFPEAVRLSQDFSNKEETSLDIYAGRTVGRDTKTFSFRICVEVKKNDPRYVDWCFFQLKPKVESIRVITNCIQSIGHINLIKLGETTNHGNDIHVQLTKFDNWGFLKHDITDFALALKNETIGNDYFKSEKTIIDDATRQAIKGTYGTVIEHVIQQVVTGDGYSNSPDIFIPIIVTNANLFLCKFDPNDVDSKTGHITKDPKFEPKDIIVYEYPTPKEVQFPEPLSSRLGSEHRKEIMKWQVLIMSPKGFAKFLDEIDKI